MYTEEDIKLFWTAYQEMFYPEHEMYADFDDNEIPFTFNDMGFYNQ